MIDPFAVVGQAVAGWLAADFLGGLAHWWEDRVGALTMPLIGRYVIAPNRLHHTDPLANADGGIVRRNLIVWAVTAVLSALILRLTGPCAFWVAITIGGIVVGEAHVWAHNPARAPRLVRLLQDVGLLLSPQHHAQHHRGDFDRRYCVLSNWLNPPLDAVRFWAALEAGLSLVGLRPNRGTA